ncbi:MAG: GMC family oxidoreductase [Kofleriaceae bacterium]
MAGATIAAHLLERGHGPVTMLEAGPPVAMRDRRTWLDYVTANKEPFEAFADAAQDLENVGDTEITSVQSRLWGRGGSTLHWGGWCPRLQPEDFALYSATGRGVDWPITYDDLEPYYCDAEAVLQISGDSSADARPRRSRPYPQPAVAWTMVDRLTIAALDRLGYAHGRMPVARNVRPANGQAACTTIGTCLYCPTGARFSADQQLDTLERHGAFRLRTGAAAQRVTMADKQRAAGVEYVDVATGRVKHIAADHVILCAGAIETPKLLLASACVEWPQGVGNDTDHVGRHLQTHPRLTSIGRAARNRSLLAQELEFPTLCSRQFDGPADQATGKMMIRVGGPLIEAGRLIAEGRPREEVEAAVRGENTFLLLGLLELVPTEDRENRIMLAPGRNRFGAARTRIKFHWESQARPVATAQINRLDQILVALGYEPQRSAIGSPPSPGFEFAFRADHALATCRMSATAETGVVDRDLRIHGTSNLFVCSNAVHPTGGCVNPTLTTTALAVRLAEHLAA